MFKKWIAFGLLLGLAGFAAFSGGCGQVASTTATSPAETTTTMPAATTSVAIKGTTSSAALTGLSVTTPFTSAEVKIGYCVAGSDEVKVLMLGTTSPDGTYEVRVPTASLEALKSTSGYVPNLMVTISKEGVVIGCVISSLSPEAGKSAFAPTATSGDYKKALIARGAFKRGSDPKSFDYSSSVDSKFSSDTVSGYDSGKIDAMADSIKSGEDAATAIATGLGISTATIEAMKQKGFELGKLYIEPIMQAAFASKTPPNRAALDTAFASVEAGMNAYARTLGLSDQQIADFKSMKNKQVEIKMGSGALAGDVSFGEAKRRMAGDKMINVFLGQWEAANTLATISPGGIATNYYSNAFSTNYLAFAASKEVIKAQLVTLLNTPGTSGEAIGNYMRTNFFDAFLFPPANADKSSPEAFFLQYRGNRIMVYFMSAFLSPMDRNTFMQTTQPAMQAIFERRFQLHRTDPQTMTQEATADYYMGPAFWDPNSPPSQTEVQRRLGVFNAALVGAIDNTTTRSIIQTNAGFSSSDTDKIFKAFRILMAPPDAM